MTEKVEAIHETEYGSKAQVIVKSPLRIHLLGEHSSFFGDKTLSLAVNVPVYAAVSKRDDTNLGFYYYQLKMNVDIRLYFLIYALGVSVSYFFSYKRTLIFAYQRNHIIMNIDSVAEYLSGPPAITMVKEDANESAKILFDFAKEAPALEVKGAYVENELLDAAKIEALSKIPGRKQLIAMLMGAINGPARQLAATLQAYVEKKQAEGGSAPAAE